MPRARWLIGVVLVVSLALAAGAVAHTHATATATLGATDDGYVGFESPTKANGDGGSSRSTRGPAQELPEVRPLVDRRHRDERRAQADGDSRAPPASTSVRSPTRRGASARSRTERSGVLAVDRRERRPVRVEAVLSLDVTRERQAGIRSFALVDAASATTLSLGSSENQRRRPAAARRHLHADDAAERGRAEPRAPPRGSTTCLDLDGEQAVRAVIGSSAAPYENQLANACGLATNYHAVTHPSLPNYIAATSGNTQGITDDAALRRIRSRSRASTARSRLRARPGATTRRALPATARSRRAACMP